MCIYLRMCLLSHTLIRSYHDAVHVNEIPGFSLTRPYYECFTISVKDEWHLNQNMLIGSKYKKKQTEAATFPCRLCFLRVLPFISLIVSIIMMKGCRSWYGLNSRPSCFSFLLYWLSKQGGRHVTNWSMCSNCNSFFRMGLVVLGVRFGINIAGIYFEVFKQSLNVLPIS